MFDKIKKYILRKKIAERKPDTARVLRALDTASDVGMLCEITDEDSYKAIFRIFSSLQQSGKNVHLIGYIDEKFVPFTACSSYPPTIFAKNSSTGTVSLT